MAGAWLRKLKYQFIGELRHFVFSRQPYLRSCSAMIYGLVTNKATKIVNYQIKHLLRTGRKWARPDEPQAFQAAPKLSLSRKIQEFQYTNAPLQNRGYFRFDLSSTGDFSTRQTLYRGYAHRRARDARSSRHSAE